MRKTIFGLLAVLLSGCVDATQDAAVDSVPPPGENGMQASTTESDAQPIDAAQLLSSSLATATAENKRVMVHLGAPG